MTREYGFDFLAPVDQRALWDHGTAPDPGLLKSTVWEVLDVWPGRSRTEMHGDVLETFDFTHWYDEIKQLTDDFMIGKWCQGDLQVLPAPDEGSLGYVHSESEGTGDDKRLCLSYVMTPLEGD